MKNKTNIRILAVALLAVLVTGCHKPTFDAMAPSKLKWSLSVIAKPDSSSQKATVETMVSQFAMQKAITGQVDWVTSDKGMSTVKSIVTQGQSDLVILSADQGDIESIARQHDQMRFAVIGDDRQPSLSNVRNITIDRKRLLFLAGFLAAEADRESNEPFSVLVDHLRSADDPDWQLILAGVKFAGRHDRPVQVLTTDLAPQDAGNTSAAGTTGTAIVQPVQKNTVRLSGRSILLLDDLTSDSVKQIKARGMKVICLDGSSKPLPVEENVVAKPATILEEAVQEEASTLAAGKWSGRQVVSLSPKSPFILPKPGLFTDPDIADRLEIIDMQLANGSLKPETYLAK